MLNKFSKNFDLIKIFLFLSVILLFFLSLSNSYAFTTTDNIRVIVGGASNGDTLLFDPGIYDKPGDNNISLNDKEITIYAKEPNTVIIDLKQSCNFINISSTGKLTLINITIKNGDMVEYGGVINNNGTLTVINCTFINNKATIKGGVIASMDNSNVTIDSTMFQNNSATYGGAIYINATKFHINQCTFIENTANDGSAVYVDNAALEIFSSVFYKNSENHVIYAANIVINLCDNFYFWVEDLNNPNNPTLTDKIDDTINVPDSIGSYYYILLSYDTNVVGRDDFTINYIMKYVPEFTANGLTVTDITMSKNGVIRDFNFKDSDVVGFPTNARGGSVDLLYEDEVFYTTMPFTYTKGNTSVILDSGDITGYTSSNNNLIAIVHDQNSKPVSNVLVYFKTADGVLLGSVLTDHNGVARLSYSTRSVFDGFYYAYFEADTYFNGNESTISKLSILEPVTSQIALSQNKDTYYVGDYITLSWSTSGIGNPDARGVIYFYENGTLQHSIQVKLSNGRLVYQFKKSHKTLDIILHYPGDYSTKGSQSNTTVIVKDKYILKIIPGLLTVAKKGYINITVTDLDGKVVNGGFVTLQFDDYDVFRIPVVKGVAHFNKVLMEAGNNRLLHVSYVDVNNVTRFTTKGTVKVNKGTPVMTLSLNPNTKYVNNRVAITTTVNNGVIKQKYNNIPYAVKFYSSGKLVHIINKKYNFALNNGINSFIYNFKRTHNNLIIIAILSPTHDYNGAVKKSSDLTIT